jgi:hypothetical protein
MKDTSTSPLLLEANFAKESGKTATAARSMVTSRASVSYWENLMDAV